MNDSINHKDKKRKINFRDDTLGTDWYYNLKEYINNREK